MRRILCAPYVMVALLVTATAACFPDFEGLTGGCRGDCTKGAFGVDAGESGEAGTRPEGGADVDASSPCPGSAGPAGARIATSSGSFCIDATEVTNDDYAKFIATNDAATAKQPSFCSWNTSFIPSAWPATGRRPVVWVDWCDAFAYCVWAGKHLCGGRGGVASTLATENDPARSEWFAACSHDGQRAYPYGASFDRSACNGDNVKGASMEVGGQASCSGGSDGVFDMSGNVEEWVAACDDSTGAMDGCLVRGGEWTSPADKLSCSSNANPSDPKSVVNPRKEATEFRGFRCCAD